ncbi:MAG: hypothetical protein Q8K78_11950 [Planctomycetaceae bacterium]|nr:hypothetical protein [Planctomycetaceae bacterium]
MDSIIRGDVPEDKTGPETLGEIISRHPYLRPTQPTQYALLLQDTPGHTIPAVIRLRSVMKLLGRGFHLRVVGVIDATGSEVLP